MPGNGAAHVHCDFRLVSGGERQGDRGGEGERGGGERGWRVGERRGEGKIWGERGWRGGE